MNPIKDIDELAAVMIEVKQAFQGGNADFAASMVSCAVIIGAHDDVDDETILWMVTETAKNSLAVAHARRQSAINGQEVH